MARKSVVVSAAVVVEDDATEKQESPYLAAFASTSAVGKAYSYSAQMLIAQTGGSLLLVTNLLVRFDQVASEETSEVFAVTSAAASVARC